MEENSSSWVRRAKLSHTMVPRSNSTRETCSRYSAAQSNRSQELKLNSLSLESKPRKLDFDSFSIPLPKETSSDSRSSKIDVSSSDVSNSSCSQSDRNLGSKASGLDVGSSSSHISFNSKFDSRIVVKPKPLTLDTSTFSFDTNGGSKLGFKWLDSSTVPTPTLWGNLHPDGSSKQSDSSTMPPPSLRDVSEVETHKLNSSPDEGSKSSSKWSDSGIVPSPALRGKSDLDSRKYAKNGGRKEMHSKAKRRSASPLPTSLLSDVFKEAKSIGKRFSTPPPSRKGTSRSHSELSPMKHLSSLKAAEKVKATKDKSWAKYFDHGGRRVASLETLDEWMVDLSKLYLGLRFASGAHSRLYHGMYKDQAVAVKIIRQPDDDDENGDVVARLEKQFFREVTFLSCLSHRNVIKVSFFIIFV